MSSKSDFIRWWTNYGEMANEEIEYPAFQAGRAFQHSVESAEIATLRAQLAEAQKAVNEAADIFQFVANEDMQIMENGYQAEEMADNWISKYSKSVTTA